MSNKKTDWKSKYYELRARYMNAIDVSFRLGFQEGTKASELQNMQMQLQQAQQQMAAAAAMPPGAGGELPPEAMAEEGAIPPEAGGELPPEAMTEGGEEMPPEGAAPVEEEEVPDELDKSIQDLESIVSKNEKVDIAKIMKSYYKNKPNDPNDMKVSEKYQKITEMIKKW